MKKYVLNYRDVIKLFYINEEVSFSLILTYLTVKNQILQNTSQVCHKKRRKNHREKSFKTFYARVLIR